MTATPTLTQLKAYYYTGAKRIWGCSMLTQALVAVCAGLVNILQLSHWLLGLVLLAATVGAGLAEWCSVRKFSYAEALQRLNEYQSLLGWPISQVAVRDAFAGAGEDLDLIVQSHTGSYWDSTAAPGPRRATECLLESAWWSKHLSASVFAIASICAGLVLVLTVAALVGLATSELDTRTRTRVAESLATAVAFLVTGRLVQIAWEYHQFHQGCIQIVGVAEARLSNTIVAESEAIMLLSDYQRLRAEAPPIPDWIYDRRKDALNRLWNRRS